MTARRSGPDSPAWQATTLWRTGALASIMVLCMALAAFSIIPPPRPLPDPLHAGANHRNVAQVPPGEASAGPVGASGSGPYQTSYDVDVPPYYGLEPHI